MSSLYPRAQIAQREKMKKEYGFTLIEVMIVVAIVAIIGAVALRGFSGILVKDQKAITAAETNGFTNVKVLEHDWLLVQFRGCDRSDVARFTISATNPANQQVQFYICSGWLFKGTTIRTK